MITDHIFNYEEKPTDLQPINLWIEPRKVAYLSKLMEQNNDDDLTIVDGDKSINQSFIQSINQVPVSLTARPLRRFMSTTTIRKMKVRKKR